MGKFRLIAAVVIVMLWTTAAIWVMRIRLRTPIKTESEMTLSTKREGNAVRLSWNPIAPQSARSAVLWISDGEKQTHMDLTRADIEKGFILYTPASDQVGFELEVLRTAARASLKFVTAQHGPPRDTQTLEAAPAGGLDTTNLVDALVVPSGPHERRTRASRTKAKPETSFAAAATPQNEPLLISPPALSTAVLEPLQAPALLELSRVALPAPVPVTSVSYSPAPDSAFEKLFKRARGVQFRGTSSDNEPEASIAATPRHQVDPDVPTFIAEALTEEVRVSLRVSIDKLGQITDVEPLAPLPEHRLVGLAGTAARKWEFEPARSKGRPVASRLILNFRFRNPHPRTAPLKGLTAAKPF